MRTLVTAIVLVAIVYAATDWCPELTPDRLIVLQVTRTLWLLMAAGVWVYRRATCRH